jgi:hypothetical protein
VARNIFITQIITTEPSSDASLVNVTDTRFLIMLIPVNIVRIVMSRHSRELRGLRFFFLENYYPKTRRYSKG